MALTTTHTSATPHCRLFMYCKCVTYGHRTKEKAAASCNYSGVSNQSLCIVINWEIYDFHGPR